MCLTINVWNFLCTNYIFERCIVTCMLIKHNSFPDRNQNYTLRLNYHCGHIFVFKNAETNILLKVKFHFTFCINKGIKKMWVTDLCHSWPPMQLHCQKKDFHVLPVLRTHKIFFFSEFACDQCWRNHICHLFTILETYHHQQQQQLYLHP